MNERSGTDDGNVRLLTVVEICTTLGDRDRAEGMAKSLVESRLAACGQVDGPIASTYRWNGHVESGTEHRLKLKTVPSRVVACLAAIQRLHDYALPEIIVAEVSASEAYGRWVEESVRE